MITKTHRYFFGGSEDLSAMVSAATAAGVTVTVSKPYTLQVLDLTATDKAGSRYLSQVRATLKLDGIMPRVLKP